MRGAGERCESPACFARGRERVGDQAERGGRDEKNERERKVGEKVETDKEWGDLVRERKRD